MPKEAYTVYVVEDDESIRKALKRLLRCCRLSCRHLRFRRTLLDSTSGRGDGCLILDIRLRE